MGSGYCIYGSFRKLGVPYFGVRIISILLFRVLFWGPLFSETPIFLIIEASLQHKPCLRKPKLYEP